MFIQPFIENAIEHGVSKIEKGKIQLSFDKRDEQLVVTIIDNGPGLSNVLEDHRSVSTTIIQERLELLNKTSRRKIQLNVTNNPGGGALVILQLPIYS